MKRVFPIICTVFVLLAACIPLTVSAEASRQDWTAITEFTYALNTFDLTSVKVAFFVVPAGTAVSVTNNNGTTQIAARQTDSFTCVYRDSAGYKLEFHNNPDFSDIAFSRVINSSQVAFASPALKPDDFVNFYDKITVTQGVRWTAGNGSIFMTLKHTLTHYIFGDDLSNVPFGSGWVDLISTVACVILFALPLLIIFFILRRF